MTKMIFFDLISKVTNSLCVPLATAFFIENLSSLQIIQLIFSSMARFSPGSHFIITSINKNLRFLTGAFQLDEAPQYNTILHSIWVTCLIYLIGHLLLLMIVTRRVSSQNHGFRRVTKALSWLFLLHSRLFFFPIQFFLLNLCYLYSSQKTPSNVEFYQRTGWMIGSVILLVINTSLAVCKEFLMYQINYIEVDYYDVKTNMYHQMVLIFKFIALFFDFWGFDGTSTGPRGSTVFHLIMGILLLLVLYMKLPFYKFQVLRLTMILATVILCLSMVSVIYVFVEDTESEASGGLHVLVLLLPPLGIKLVLSQFQSLFKRILQGKFMGVNHAIHFGLLLEDFVVKERINSIKYSSFFPTREDYYGVLAVEEGKIPLEKFTDRKLINECELPIYLHIMNKLSSVTSNSKLLALYIGQISLTKVNNIPKALEIIRKLESRSDSSSVPMKNSIKYLNDLLEKVHSEDDFGSDNQLHLSHYFKYYDIANSVKSLMLAETYKQIEFWEEIRKRELDAKKVFDKAEEIDHLWRKIRKICEFNLNNFRKNCTSPMLLYSVYLNHVRQMHSEGFQILRSFQSIMFAQSGNNQLEASGNVAVIVVSLDKAKVGTILNASGSIHNIFSHKKTELIGKKFGCLFPSSIAKNYQQNIQEYAKAPEYKLDSKERTYGKTNIDEIFELEVHFQLYPYVNKELTLMVVLKKLDDPAPILIADSEGHIVDCSRTLEMIFTKAALNIKTFHSLKDLNSGLEDANLAFNIIYSKNPWLKFENTAFDFEESTRRSLLHGVALSSGSARMRKPALITGMSFDKAESLCKEYQEGRQIVLSSLQKKSQVRAHVNIKPFRVEEDIYKIVRINNLKKEITSILESSDEVKTFADEFPSETEKMSVTRVITTPLKSPLGTVGYLIGSGSESNSEADTQEVQRNLKAIQHQVRDQDEGSSIKNSHHVESRTVTTLRDIGSRKKLQRNLCSLQILLCAMILVILSLSFAKYSLSESSIGQIEKGINIINLATLRLHNVINTFLWSLIYVLGVNPTQAMSYFTISLAKFAESSSELEEKLGFIQNKDLMNRAFHKDVKYWQLAVKGDVNVMTIDTFTATTILMTKYLQIREAKNMTQIRKMPDLVQTFNNSANDYILSSNALISATDVILGEIISRDIVVLKVVLSVEIVALVGYVGVFIVMVYIISKSYQRLCRALVRTQDIAISQRIAQLTKIKYLLEDDIERKAFIQDCFDLFIEEGSVNRAAGVKAKKATHQSNVQMSLMNRYLVRITIICLFFIPMFAALFAGTLVKSIKTFRTLGSVNEELSMLSDGSLQSNLMMSTLVYGSLNAGYSSMLFLNKAPLVQVTENFKNFNGINQRLIAQFLSTSNGREIDPFMVEILQRDVCGHISDVSKGLCQYATGDQDMGLLSLNTEYYNTLQNVVNSFGLKSSLANALASHSDIFNKVIGEMNAMIELYPVMMSHILAGFEETVQASKNDEIKFIIVTCITMTIYTVFVYLKPMKDFRRVDVGRRKILKIIPFGVFQDNKALKFYLMQDFKTEVEGIKNKL